MVNSGLQISGFCLGLLGFIASIVTCFLPSWRKSDLEGEVIEAVYRANGLWVRCTFQTTGLWTCDDYDSFFLGLPVALQAARALCCVSMLMGLFATLVCAVGLECTSIGSGNPRMKSRLVIVSGVLHIIGGVAVGAAVSWFASDILQEYYNIIQIQNVRYVYGEALFVGWVGMVISIITGLILCCSSWNSDDEDTGRSYAYNPPRSKANGPEYI